jgi:RHS repeat-associated protein
VFPSLRLNHAEWTGDDYERNARTEAIYLGAHARVLASSAARPRVDRKPHVFLTLGDHQGSTSIVIDKATSELVSATTYQPYGRTESDYRPARWQEFREDYRFTGKEEDAEVGLTFFGARYYHPQLARWMSADPLTVHTSGADPNPYAYVGGSPVQHTDPLGLSHCNYELDPGCVAGDKPKDFLGQAVQVAGDFVAGLNPFGRGGGSSGGGPRTRGPAEKPKPPPPPPPKPTTAVATTPSTGSYDPVADQQWIERLTKNIWNGVTVETPKGLTYMMALGFMANPAMAIGMYMVADKTTTAWTNVWKADTTDPVSISPNGISVDGASLAGMAIGIIGGGLLLGGGASGLKSAFGAGGRAAVNAVSSEIAAEATQTAVAEAAPSVEAILQEHVETAIVTFSRKGLTPLQRLAVKLRPRMEPAFRGERIDFFFRQSLMTETRLPPTIEMTPRFRKGPDLFDATNKVWWDLTTPEAWPSHVTRYQQWGRGVPLLYIFLE